MSFLTTVIPVYNGENYLREALDSLCQQTRKPDRIIVLDDGSTDHTPDIAREYADRKCEVCHNPKNLGLFPNHNRALEFAAETDYLHILHANDTLHPRFFEEVLSPLEKCPGHGIAYSHYAVMQENGTLLSSASSTQIEPARPVALAHFLGSLSHMHALTINAVVMKSMKRPLPCKFPTHLPQLGDVHFHSELATHFQTIFEIPTPLCFYRLHPGATRLNRQSIQAFVKDEWDTMQFVAGLIPEGSLSKSWRHMILTALFASRSRVKMQYAQSDSPEYAREIEEATREIVGPFFWILGKTAVFWRDLLLYKLARQKPNDLLNQ